MLARKTAPCCCCQLEVEPSRSADARETAAAAHELCTCVHFYRPFCDFKFVSQQCIRWQLTHAANLRLSQSLPAATATCVPARRTRRVERDREIGPIVRDGWFSSLINLKIRYRSNSAMKPRLEILKKAQPSQHRNNHR